MGQFDVVLFAGTIAGVALVIASACVINNILDRDIDSKMERTNKRALVTNEVSTSVAASYATVLGITGLTSLLWLSSITAALFAVIGFVAYAGWYTYAKRKTPLSTIIGTISGATPIVIGYTAVTDQFNTVALVLFAVMVYWQLAHFYAISLYRQKEYAKAGIPLWPIKYSRQATASEIIKAGGFYVVVVLLLAFVAKLSIVYVIVMGVLALWWFYTMVRTDRMNPSDKWAKKIFGQSLLILLAWSVLLSVDYWLP